MPHLFCQPLLNILKNKHATYAQQQDASNHAALARLLECYDIGIQAAVKKDAEKANAVLALLESSLDSSLEPAIALSLRGIYQTCRQHIADHNWADYAENLERLKGLWQANQKIIQATI